MPPPADAKPPTAAEAMPATRPEVLPPIDVGAWSRVGAVFQKASDPKSLSDWHMDNAYVELHAGGKIHKNVSVTVNLNANMLNLSTPNAVNVEDAIIAFDFDEAFHLWAGHLLVPVDRANASGPFFMIPWNYPGVISNGASLALVLPHEGPSGRNNGAVVWGQGMDGKVKLLVGAFDNGDVTTSPLISGRLNLALIGSEPGFWGNASYFGDKDVLAVGLGAQYQKNGLATKAYSEFNADVLAEFKTGGGGWVTGEAAFYHYASVDMTALQPKTSLYILGAFASPVVGVGNIQPMVRYQYAKDAADTAISSLDIAAAYLIKGPALRVIGTFEHNKIGDVSSNSLQLGAQAIFF
jgi:hypothetical protein